MPDATSWRKTDLSSDCSWIHILAGDELTTLTHLAALGEADRRPQSIDLFDAAVERLVSRIKVALVHGPGIFLLRGGKANSLERIMLANIQSYLCRRLGTIRSQDSAGRLVSVVTQSEPGKADPARTNGHLGSAEMLPHSDSAEIASLMCVRAAMSGGETTLVSATRIHDVIKELSPACLSQLYQNFFFDISGKINPADGPSYLKRPVFYEKVGRIRCHYNRRRIQTGTRNAGQQMASEARVALDLVDKLATSDELSYRLTLEPGDNLFINNDFVLHGRTAYRDWPYKDCGRMLLRVWLDMSSG